MLNQNVRIWYCPNPECKNYKKDARDFEKGAIFGRCIECKTQLKTIKGVIKK